MYPSSDRETFRTTIHTPVEEVYRAFTRGAGLAEWLCNGARTFPKIGGMVTMWWNNGYYTAGEFLRLELNREVVFSWHGRSEPQATQVEVQMASEGTNTVVTVTHSGLGSEEIWTEPRREILKGWEKSLENLVSVLETGRDLRVVNRPGMGIYPAELSPETKLKHHFPVDQGIYLHDVIEGRGAQKGGLQPGDLVTKLAGISVDRIETLLHVLSRQKMGSHVEVEYYSGPEKKVCSIELMPLPVPEVPATHGELIDILEKSYMVELEKLSAVVQDIPDNIAEWKPSPTEWSAKEVLAHLIHTERDNQLGLHSMLLDEDFMWVDNTSERGLATIGAYPSLKDLMEEVRRSSLETIAFLKVLPESFLAHKGSHWRVAQNLLTADAHIQEHIDQIKENLEQYSRIAQN